MPFIAGADPDFSLVVVIQDVQNADSVRLATGTAT
jgi:hypothetical protein